MCGVYWQWCTWVTQPRATWDLPLWKRTDGKTKQQKALVYGDNLWDKQAKFVQSISEEDQGCKNSEFRLEV